MSEAYPSDHSLLQLVDDSETGVEYIETGQAPYYVEFRRLLHRLLLATRRANDLRVFDEGGLMIGVKGGKYWVGRTLRSYGGSSGQELADDKAVIYVYLDESGDLVTNEYTSWPNPCVPHIRLAVVTTSGGDITEIVDARDHHMWAVPGRAAYSAAEGAESIVLIASLSAGNTATIFNANAPFKLHIIDAWSVATSADAGTWKLSNGTNDITNAVAVTAADKTVNRAGTIDDAYHEIAANGSLSVVGDGSLADVIVYILAVRVA